jgi:ATP-dependent RNA helicase DDX52/ROK1
MKRFLDLFLKFHPTYALFSATIQHAVEEVLTTYLHDCVRIEVGGRNRVLEKIEQSIEYCTNELGKLIFLKNLITEGKLVPPVLIFVQEKQRAKQLYYEITRYLRSELQGGRRIEFLSSDKSK